MDEEITNFLLTKFYNVMKKRFLLKTMLLLCALIAGSSSVWATDDPNWSYTVVNGDASKLNTTLKTFTVDASHVWSYEGTTVAAGEPAVTIGKSTIYGLKFGNSGTAYYSPVILSTSAFSDKAITKVRLHLKHNGSKSGTLRVKQGSVTIGTATTSSTSSWIDVTCTESQKGAGGTLTIQYEVAQALLINKIEVWYEDLGTATTTTIDASGITNTDIYLGTAAGSLSASVTETVGGAAVGGATVTWTSSDEDVATIAADGTVTLKKKGSTTITASYAGDETYAASSAEYVLNVTNSAPQETDIIVATNYEWLGVANKGSIAGATEIDCEGVTVTVDKGEGSTAPRGDDTYIRLYAKNSLKFEAPANYVVTEIIFTKANSKWDNSFNVDAGSWDNTELTWTGAAKEVTLTEAGSSGNNQFSQMEIKLAASKDVVITAAGWASFSSASALDFTNTDVTAYIAKSNGGTSSVTLTEIKKVPAETGIVVNAPAGTYAIPVLSGDPAGTTGNLLMPWLTAGTPTEGTYYTLAVDGTSPIFKRSSGGTLAAGKAYLVMPAGAPELGVDFGGTTGINSIENGKLKIENSELYNLNGQRVANPTKGLYIVNGKKVIVK